MEDNSTSLGQHLQTSPRILFTCTTFLSLPGKLLQCLRAITSIKMMHSEEDLAKVSRFLFINECPTRVSSINFKKAIESTFSWVEVIGKDRRPAGPGRLA